MGNVILIKRSKVQGAIPTASDLQEGELALNLKDKKIFTRSDDVIFELKPASNDTPLANGTGSSGVSGSLSRSDHVHPEMILKTINNQSIKGPGNITISGSGSGVSSSFAIAMAVAL
jgi:hypothetical protein